ncbi:MAG: hypothetical protein A9Z00_14875 [Thermobacillus sp. ZCTH02-B1]|nr:MAG: hypothetical protein A9Z00_14875 [Thermobacillus sp. ZCTH02-B1]
MNPASQATVCKRADRMGRHPRRLRAASRPDRLRAASHPDRLRTASRPDRLRAAHRPDLLRAASRPDRRPEARMARSEDRPFGRRWARTGRAACSRA